MSLMQSIIAISSTSGEDKNQLYIDAITFHGGKVLILKPGDSFKKLGLHGILLTGGGDLSEYYYDHPLSELERKTLGKIEPEREQYEQELLTWASQYNVSTLGVCRGCQILNIFAHGTLIPDIPTWYSQKQISSQLTHRQKGDPTLPAHDIYLETQGQLYRLLGSVPQISVNSSHHQALSRCGKGLTITARAPDGIIEAIEDFDKTFWIGVQFHPERMWKRFPIFSNLFRRFLETARSPTT